MSPRGKYLEFYREGNTVAFLDAEAFSFVEEIARKRNTDVSTVVNQLIKIDRQIADYAQGQQ